MATKLYRLSKSNYQFYSPRGTRHVTWNLPKVDSQTQTNRISYRHAQTQTDYKDIIDEIENYPDAKTQTNYIPYLDYYYSSWNTPRIDGQSQTDHVSYLDYVYIPRTDKQSQTDHVPYLDYVYSPRTDDQSQKDHVLKPKSYSHIALNGFITPLNYSNRTIPNKESLFSFQCPPEVYKEKNFKALYEQLYSCSAPEQFDRHFDSDFEYLSRDIWKKYMLHRPSFKWFMEKMRVWKQLLLLLENKRPNDDYKLLLIGSTLTGLSIDGSDLNLCLKTYNTPGVTIRDNSISHLDCYQELLSSIKEVDELVIFSPQVPILKFKVHGSHPININIMCDSDVRAANSQLVYRYVQCDWRLQPLYSVVKQWAVYNVINNPYGGMFSSYSLILLVINFLQFGVSPPVLPCLHDIIGDELIIKKDILEYSSIELLGQWKTPWTSSNVMSLGELLIEFFKFYSELNFAAHTISVRLGKTLVRSAETKGTSRVTYSDHVLIEEPFTVANTAFDVNTRRNMTHIKRKFDKAAEALQNTMNLENLFSEPEELWDSDW